MHDVRQQGCTVLIVAPPGRLRDALQAMVRAVPQVKNTLRADDGPSTLSVMAERLPALVFVDANCCGEEASALLEHIKAGWPDTRVVMLVDNTRMIDEAARRGADSALVRGFTLTTLAQSIQNALC